MKAHQLYALQQQAKQNRLMEKQLAAQEGKKPSKPSLFQRLVLGVKR